MLLKYTPYYFTSFVKDVHCVLCVTGKQDAVDATLETLNVISEPLKSMARMMVDVCAYAGSVNELVFICVCNSTEKCNIQFKSLKFHCSLKLLIFVNFAGTGNVLKVQHLLHVCSEHDDSKDQV